MEGMIFAAGLGTRLRPLTNDRPKALVVLNGKTLLLRSIERMVNAGVKRIVINIHHFAELMRSEIANIEIPGVELIISDESDLLLDTGGGLKSAAKYFTKGEPVLIHNVDIYTELDLAKLISTYETSPKHAMMVIRKSVGGRVLKFGKAMKLSGWMNTETGEEKISRSDFYEADIYSFCGIHIVGPSFIDNISGDGVFSIIDEYISQAKQFDVEGYMYDGVFVDLGTPQAIAQAESFVV